MSHLFGKKITFEIKDNCHWGFFVVSGHLQLTRFSFFMMLSRADHFRGILTSYCINFLEILCSVQEVMFAVFDDKISILKKTN